MRIVCPVCSVAYDVPDSLVPPGRVVRCARCGDEWAPVAAAPPEATYPPPEPEPHRIAETAAPLEMTPLRRSAMDRLAAHPVWPRTSLRLRLAWIGSVLLLVLAIAGAFVWRNEIVALWPPSARAYAAFGLHPQQGRSAHD